MKGFGTIALAILLAWASLSPASAAPRKGPMPGKAIGRGGPAHAAPRAARPAGGPRHAAGPSRGLHLPAKKAPNGGKSPALRKPVGGTKPQPMASKAPKAGPASAGKPRFNPPRNGGANKPGSGIFVPGAHGNKPGNGIFHPGGWGYGPGQGDELKPGVTTPRTLQAPSGSPLKQLGKAGPAVAQSAKQPPSEHGPSGKLQGLIQGKSTNKLDLAKQRAMWKQGDVAVQLGLHPSAANVGNATKAANAANVNIMTNVTNVINLNKVTNIFAAHFKHWHVHHHYCGWISPKFVHGCFWFNHWGTWYYPHYVLYPKWCRWVRWCYYYHGPVWCDPRPLWCRPLVYVAAPRWVWWKVPVWVPLPVVACGTWVDVPPVVVGPEDDLQLLAIRFVEPGHPEEQTGPRYRLWFRNNSTEAIRRPFNVMLFASRDEELSGDLPQAGVRVTSIEPGQVQAVDIRLPIEVYSMEVDDGGRPAPFSTLHALVDAAQEVPEAFEANNGATLAREEILPVDPVAFALEPGTAAAGGEVVLAGEGLGPGPGQVLVVLGGIEMEAEILGWYDCGVQIALPEVPLAGATEAELFVVRGDGAAANPLQITITRPSLNREATPAPSDAPL